MQGNNILFIMADEHNYNCINQLGNDFIITPNIDSLVKEGTTFTSAYTPSPLCVPARASLATGTYVHKNKYWDGAHAYDARIPGWQHVLRDNNVNVTSIGKLHYKDRTIDTGFTETIEPMHLKDGLGDLFGLLREEMPPKDACKRLSEELGRGDCEYLEYDRLITNKAIEWIRKQKKERSQTARGYYLYLLYRLTIPLLHPLIFMIYIMMQTCPMIITRIYQKISCIHGLRVYEKVGHTMITWMRKKEKSQCKLITVCVVLWTQMWVNCSRNLNNVIYMMILQLFMQVITESHLVIEGFGER